MSPTLRQRVGASSRTVFTSESVTEGQPDKICDLISDAILDAVLAPNPNGGVAVETLAMTGMIVVAGQLTTTAYVDIQQIVRRTIKDIGYDDPAYGFHWQDCDILVSLDEQSSDIAIGVAETISIFVETFGTSRYPAPALERLIREHFVLTPLGIIKHLQLRPIYQKTAVSGHFGRFHPSFPWEKTDMAALLRRTTKRLTIQS